MKPWAVLCVTLLAASGCGDDETSTFQRTSPGRPPADAVTCPLQP